MKFLENDEFYVSTPEDMKWKREKRALVSHLHIYNSFTKKLVLKDIYGYSCLTWFQKKGGEVKYKSHNFKIAGATTLDSVFILKRLKWRCKINCDNASQNACQITDKANCQIVALVENLYSEYT